MRGRICSGVKKRCDPKTILDGKSGVTPKPPKPFWMDLREMVLDWNGVYWESEPTPSKSPSDHSSFAPMPT